MSSKSNINFWNPILKINLKCLKENKSFGFKFVLTQMVFKNI